MTAISWVGTGEKNIREDLGLEMIQWCETPSPDVFEVRKPSDGLLADGAPTGHPDQPAANSGSFVSIVQSSAARNHELDRATQTRAKLSKATKGTTGQKQKDNQWPKLSDELVMHIFSFLSQSDLGHACLVCDSWRRLAFDDSLWRTMLIQNISMAPELLFRAVSRNPRKLDITNCDFEDYEELGPEYFHIAAPPRMPLAIRRLNLCSTRLSNETVAGLLQFMPKLRSLEFGGNLDLGDVAATAIANHCPKLTCLSLRMLTGLSHKGIQKIAEHCPDLKVLSLGWALNPRSSDEASAAWTQAVASSLAANCRKLEHIDLSGCREHLKDEDVATLIEGCRRLVTIDLSDSYILSDGAIDAIVANLDHAKYVSLSRCHQVTIPAMKRLAGKPGIKGINLFGCYQNVDVALKEFGIAINDQALCSLDFEGGAPDSL